MLLAAIVALTAGLLLRAAAPGALLFPGTMLAGAAIAVMNVLLSSLIKRRWPERAGFLIGLYITALSVGAIIGLARQRAALARQRRLGRCSPSAGWPPPRRWRRCYGCRS